MRALLSVVAMFTLVSSTAQAAPIYTFEAIPPFQTGSFSDISDGVTATFTSSDFIFVTPSTVFSTLPGQSLVTDDNDPDTLDVTFSAPFSAFTLNFAVNGLASDTFTVQAYSGGFGGTLLGTTIVNGAIPGGFSFPEGFATLDFGGVVYFDALRITSSAEDFAIDNLALRTPGDAPVPEPTSMLLLGTGLAGLGARRWRQRKQ